MPTQEHTLSIYLLSLSCYLVLTPSFHLVWLVSLFLFSGHQQMYAHDFYRQHDLILACKAPFQTSQTKRRMKQHYSFLFEQRQKKKTLTRALCSVPCLLFVFALNALCFPLIFNPCSGERMDFPIDVAYVSSTFRFK